MTWDYQRRGTFNVIWHGQVQIEPGQLTKFIGSLTDARTMQAEVIIERDGTVHEQPDASKTEEKFPLEGKVYACDFERGKTYISVYQTIPNLFSFPNLTHHVAFLVVPELWNFLEEKGEWGDAIPRIRRLRELQKDRYEFPEINDNAWAVYRYANLAGIFKGDEVRQINGSVASKIEKLFRLKKRVEFGNKLKLHLLTLSVGEGRSYLLDELIHEGPMTLEHSAYTAYAVLDITAHLVNVSLKIGVPDQQTSFTSVLGKDSAEPTDRSLRSLFPDLALTKYWLEQQTDWIADLRELRHEFAHRGGAEPVYGPNERLLAMIFNVAPGEAAPLFDVEEYVTKWFSKVEAFFTRTLQLLADYCVEAAKPFEEAPVRPPIETPKINSVISDTKRDILRLLFTLDGSNPEREKHLYARLERDWRRTWPLQKFKKFLAEIESIGMDNRSPGGYSIGGSVVSTTSKVVLVARGKSFPWLLEVKKHSADRAYLVRTPLTIPLNFATQTQVAGYSAKQSGPQTGHSCAEFRFDLRNTGERSLVNIQAVVTHLDREVARADVGTLEPGQTVPVYAITTPELGKMKPPGGPYYFVTLLSEPVVIRVVYYLETELGNEWVDAHLSVKPALNVPGRL